METVSDAASFEVLAEEELAAVIGGAGSKLSNPKEFVYRKIGMCGCGLAH